MTLLPTWNRNSGKPSVKPPGPQPTLPKRPQYYTEAIRHLKTADATSAFVEFASQRPLTCIGLAFTYTYTQPGVPITGEHTAWDPCTISPGHLALMLAEKGADNSLQEYSVIIHLVDAAVTNALRPLFALPVCFVGHELQASLFCLWQLGLTEPYLMWDTWVHERVHTLGKFHKRYFTDEVDLPPSEEIGVSKAMEMGRQTRLSLPETCARHGIKFPFMLADDRLPPSPGILTNPDYEQINVEYALACARAASQLYPAQTMSACLCGTLHHLVTVEMPWIAPNARMSWTGVRIDAARRTDIINRVTPILDQLTQALRSHGLHNPGSRTEMQDCFQRLGILHHFGAAPPYVFDKEALGRVAQHHTVVRLLLHWRRARDIRSDKLLWPQLVSADGRLRAEMKQLGAETGRQSSRWPNLLGISRWLRPLVVPAPGYGIGEADWSQIELGVAAAIFGDAHLVAMFNSGDVYSAMAQHFFADELSPADQGCSSLDFKQRHPERRAQMKVCTLGILYGLGPDSLAIRLDTSYMQAMHLLARFQSLFPVLCKAKDKAVHYGAIRGYATTVTGLRRHRAHPGYCSTWERNWLGNHPVQGSAADVFKMAGIRLDRLYPPYSARLLVPLHDAFIFEAPLEHLEAVATLTSQVMVQVLQEVFPVLKPRVTVNIAHPECWNKDGLTAPLDIWYQELAELALET